MRILSLTLRNFRNHHEERYLFGPQINLICGPNARGKTSILEALHLLMTGRSFRAQHLKEMIRHGSSEFYIDACFIKFGVEQTLRFSYDGKERKIYYNHTPCKTSASLIGIIPGTVMIPDDISMIKGAPTLRRRYLDILLAQSDPLYVHHLMRYERALKYRNFLLKEKSKEALEVWEEELAKGGSYIAAKRFSVLVDLEVKCRDIMSELSNETELVALNYKCQCPRAECEKIEYYLQLLRKMRPREINFGSTLVGPHKDDLNILIEGKEARHFASEGQKRSLVSALRFAEWQCLKSLVEVPPLMLIDDLGISLDMRRRQKLLKLLGDLNQVFITTTEKDEPLISTDSCCLIELS